MPVLNGAATIGKALGALRGQAPITGGHELIVVDNGSSDATREIARGFGATLLEQPKRGPSAARNLGLEMARGAIVVHLDADIVPTRRWLREIVAPFARPEVVLVGGRTLTFPPGTAAERYVASSGRFEPENNVYRDPFPFAPSQNLAVRRDAARRAGGWAEDLLFGEDIDFCHRVLRACPGGAIVYAPEALVLHHERTSDEALRRQALSYGSGAAEIYMRYPDVVRWDLAKSLRLAQVLLGRGLAPPLLRLGRIVGAVPPERIEFAVY
ncbi:MAG TPA: glycosyltransferase, partial [Geminicoccaceae bacterium]|nr:glycosyltransferase [Geminicoccaceae bacterium]